MDSLLTKIKSKSTQLQDFQSDVQNDLVNVVTHDKAMITQIDDVFDQIIQSFEEMRTKEHSRRESLFESSKTKLLEVLKDTQTSIDQLGELQYELTDLSKLSNIELLRNFKKNEFERWTKLITLPTYSKPEMMKPDYDQLLKR